MSEPSTSTTVPAKESNSQLATSQGRTTIASSVVSKIAGIATREVDGVASLGGSGARMAGALRDRIPGSTSNHAQGVHVEVGEIQAAADIDIVADYGVAIADLAAAIRRNVIDQVQQMTGLDVVEVNVTVHDVKVPQEDREGHETEQLESGRPSRVQ